MPEAELTEDGLPARMGCATRLSALLILVFVNVPAIDYGPVRLWHKAPVLVAVAAVVDLFVLLITVLGFRRRIAAVRAHDDASPS